MLGDSFPSLFCYLQLLTQYLQNNQFTLLAELLTKAKKDVEAKIRVRLILKNPESCECFQILKS